MVKKICLAKPSSLKKGTKRPNCHNTRADLKQHHIKKTRNDVLGVNPNYYFVDNVVSYTSFQSTDNLFSHLPNPKFYSNHPYFLALFPKKHNYTPTLLL